MFYPAESRMRCVKFTSDSMTELGDGWGLREGAEPIERAGIRVGVDESSSTSTLRQPSLDARPAPALPSPRPVAGQWPVCAQMPPQRKGGGGESPAGCRTGWDGMDGVEAALTMHLCCLYFTLYAILAVSAAFFLRLRANSTENGSCCCA